MARYQHRPVEVEAFCWNGQPSDDWPEWAQGRAEVMNNGRHLLLPGKIFAHRGQFVVLHGDAKLDALSPEAFEPAYQMADAPVPEPVGRPEGITSQLRIATAALAGGKPVR